MRIPLAIALALFMPFPGAVTGALMGVAVLVCGVAAGYLHARTKNWQRYKQYAPEP